MLTKHIYDDMPISNTFITMAKATTQKERSTLFIEEGIIQSLKFIAFTEDITRTDIINDALTEYIKQWQKKNGPIPKPKKT